MSGAESRLEVGAGDRRCLELRRAGGKHLFLNAGHGQRRDGDLLAVEVGVATRRREHVDVMADQMLALARRVAAAADRHAEAGQHERARERPHRVEVAGQERLGRVQQDRFVFRQHRERRASIRRAVQMVGKQPVDLRRGPAQRIAETGPDHPRRRRRQNLEVHEDRQRRRRRQRLLVPVDGDRGIHRRVAVHRRRRGEHDVRLAVLRRRELAEVVDRSGADRDERVGRRRRRAAALPRFPRPHAVALRARPARSCRARTARVPRDGPARHAWPDR